MGISDCIIVNLPKITDTRGNLSFIEAGRPVPFVIQRTYWIYDVSGGEVRGGHAYKELQEFFVALSGSFDVVLDDGKARRSSPSIAPISAFTSPTRSGGIWRISPQIPYV